MDDNSSTAGSVFSHEAPSPQGTPLSAISAPEDTDLGSSGKGKDVKGPVNRQDGTGSPPTGLAVRRRIVQGGPSKQRSHQDRPDGLEYLNPRDNTGLLDISDSEHPDLAEIVYCLIRLDLHILSTCEVAYDINDYTTFGREEIDDIRDRLPLNEAVAFYDKKDTYRSDVQLDEAISRYVQNMSKIQLLQRIQDMRTTPFLPKMILQSAENWYEIFQRYEKAKERSENDSRVWELKASNLRASRAAQTSYNLVLRLRNGIVDAIKSKELTEIALKKLKTKIISMEENWDTLLSRLKKTEPKTLVYTGEQWWRENGSDAVPGDFVDKDPRNVVEALNGSDNGIDVTNPTLSFLVPIMSALSIIPAVLAWTHSNNDVGSSLDSDFWQLISASSIQIVGLFTLIIPTRLNQGVVRQAWIYTWILVAFSGICSVGAIPLYLYTATHWSAAVAFAGNVAQAFVILQLMYSIDS